jgi:cell division protein FtsN
MKKSILFASIIAAVIVTGIMGYLNSGNPITASDITFAKNQSEPQIICAES